VTRGDKLTKLFSWLFFRWLSSD